jgi:hypothetical protein
MKAKVNCDQRTLFLLRPLLIVSPKLLGRADEVTGTRAALSMRLLTERFYTRIAERRPNMALACSSRSSAAG